MSDVSRREFLAAGTGALALTVVEDNAAEKVGSHHIPEDKNLSRAWLESLAARMFHLAVVPAE